MSPATVRAALHVPGLRPQTSRLLAHMADRADDRALFYERRDRTAHLLGVHRDTIKASMKDLIERGYVSEDKPARSGKYPRRLRLHPGNWPHPDGTPEAEAPEAPPGW